MTTTVANYERALKILYKDLEVNLYKKHPLWGILPKSEKFFGKNEQVPLLYAPTGGASRTFATAQANKSTAPIEGFNVTRVKDYSLLSIETEVLRASANDAGAVMSALKTQGDAAKNAIERSICHGLYRNQGGSRGRVGSTSTTTLTLLDPNDIVFFEVGMTIVSDDTDGTAGGAADTEGAVITAVDRDAGTITRSDANWTAIGNFANNDFLFRQGDFGQSLAGLDAYLPETAPGGGDSFFGVNRSVDTRLSGLRYVATGGTDGTIPRALVNAGARCQREGAAPDCGMVNPITFAKIVNQMETQTEYEKVPAMSAAGKIADIGYTGLVVMLGSGPCKLIADADCPVDVAYLLQKDTWVLKSLGRMPGWIDDDGSGHFLREGGADAMEGRLGYFANLICKQPSYNMRVNLSEVA